MLSNVNHIIVFILIKIIGSSIGPTTPIISIEISFS